MKTLEVTMEFEKDSKPSQGVSDEERRLAESKKLQLTPIHADLAPDDDSDAEIAARHLAAPAIKNAPGDVEQESRRLTPRKTTLPVSPLPHHVSKAIQVIAYTALFLCVLLFTLVFVIF